MTLKLAISIPEYKSMINFQRYRTICVIIDTWFHVHRGIHHPNIDYVSLAMFTRKLLIDNIGMRVYPTDTVIEKTTLVNTETTLKMRMTIIDKIPYLKQHKNVDSTHLLRRFTGHTLFHLITDVDNWENMNIANCKHHEKTNKNTKQSVIKGARQFNFCRRIMIYYTNLLKGTYILEGNTVNDEGYFDLNGKHKIKNSLLSKLTNMKWLSVFWHMKHNPLENEYNDGHQLEKKIQPKHLSQYFKNKTINTLTELVRNYFQKEKKITDISWYSNIKYWRQHKQHQIQRGTLIARKNNNNNNNNNNNVEFCLVIGMGCIYYNDKTTEEFVLGHQVIKDRRFLDGCRNIHATFTRNMVVWKIVQILYNVRYLHLCRRDSNCRFTNNDKKPKFHKFNVNDKIALFWFTGVGKFDLRDTLYVYERKNFTYYY